jgi:serine/threonine protein kinase
MQPHERHQQERKNPVENTGRLDELLSIWEDRYEAGEDVSPEELCRDCPELLSEVSNRIDALKRVAWLNRPIEAEHEETFRLGPAGQGGRTVPAPIPMMLADRYRLDVLIGEGGFGEVWRGFDLELQRQVAIKIPRRERLARPEDAEAYLGEARILASLDHPNIVPV